MSELKNQSSKYLSQRMELLNDYSIITLKGLRKILSNLQFVCMVKSEFTEISASNNSNFSEVAINQNPKRQKNNEQKQVRSLFLTLPYLSAFNSAGSEITTFFSILKELFEDAYPMLENDHESKGNMSEDEFVTHWMRLNEINSYILDNNNAVTALLEFANLKLNNSYFARKANSGSRKNASIKANDRNFRIIQKLNQLSVKTNFKTAYKVINDYLESNNERLLGEVTARKIFSTWLLQKEVSNET